jgi:uncharacterized protein YbjT (DUF2867 family)
MMRRIVVLGGTGFVGHALCEQLTRRWPGVRLVVPTRRPQFGLAIQSLPGVELVKADACEPAVLRRLLLRADAVINLIAILHGTEDAFVRLHAAFPAELAKACRELQVPRLLHVSALGVSASAPSHYLRSKALGEATLLETASGIVTVLRPSVIFGAQDRFMNVFAQLQSVAPAVPLAMAQARFQPVWVEDVAQGLVRSLTDQATMGQTYECCGPTVYTLGDLVRLAGQWSGHPRPVIPMPQAVGRLQAAVMSLLPGSPLMSADNLDSMRVPSVATPGAPGLQALGIEPQAMEAVVPGYLSAGQGVARLDRWRAQR